MENYKKGRNVEEALDRTQMPIKNIPYNFLWMQVRGGSRIRNLLTHALNEFAEIKYVVWTGYGQSVGKAVTCAEIMKRQLGNNVYQITWIGYRGVDEYWDPMLPNLDQIVVKRKLPLIHILLSSEKLESSELGYQAPGTHLKYDSQREHKNKSHNRNKDRRKLMGKKKNKA